MNLNLKRNWYAVTCSVPVLTASTMNIQTEGMLWTDEGYYAVTSKRGGYKVYGENHIEWCLQKEPTQIGERNSILIKYPGRQFSYVYSIAELTALK